MSAIDAAKMIGDGWQCADGFPVEYVALTRCPAHGHRLHIGHWRGKSRYSCPTIDSGPESFGGSDYPNGQEGE